MKDPFVEKVRRVRMDHTRQFNSNMHAICEDLRRFEVSLKERIVTREPRRIHPTRKAN